MLDRCIDRKGNSKLDTLQREYHFGKSGKGTNSFYLHAFKIQGSQLLVWKPGDRRMNGWMDRWTLLLIRALLHSFHEADLFFMDMAKQNV